MARARNAAVVIVHDFLVVGNPAGHAADSKQDGEHVYRNADRAHDDTAVEIHVRIKFAGNEIIVVKSDFFEFLAISSSGSDL